jgi:hypothetical protein
MFIASLFHFHNKKFLKACRIAFALNNQHLSRVLECRTNRSGIELRLHLIKVVDYLIIIFHMARLLLRTASNEIWHFTDS